MSPTRPPMTRRQRRRSPYRQRSKRNFGSDPQAQEQPGPVNSTTSTAAPRTTLAPQHEPPPERDLGREPVGQWILLGVDHDRPIVVEPTQVAVGEDADPREAADVLVLRRQRIAGEEVRRCTLAAPRAEHEHQLRSRV